MTALADLKQRLECVTDLGGAQAVLGWDQETYMPSGGVEARSHQLATLARLGHELFTDPEVGDLLARAAEETVDLDADSDDARLLSVVRRDYDRATRLPADLVAALTRVSAQAQHAWKDARQRSQFNLFAPHLEEILLLVREKADAFGYDDGGCRYDALLDEYEPDMKTAEVATIFTDLRKELVPIVHAIGGRPSPNAAILRQTFNEQAQWDFGLSVIGDFGYDFTRGRQDRSAHPFSTSFSVNDCRITTRVQPDYLPSCLFGTLHEAGHAMYEQGVDPALERTVLASGTSLGIHESQSRLWENLVGRSRGFWQHYFAPLQSAFPQHLATVELETFYRAINRVEPSLIRVEADEVTYNLHIMLRFELERALLDGELAVEDLPAEWNERSEAYLGLRPGSDAEGALQDIHWSFGAIGYFPTYALGNLISTQLWQAAKADLGDLDEQIAQGSFGELRGWLRDKIHRHGRKLTATELLQRATGEGLRADSWLAYVRSKFGEIYDL